MIDVVERVEHSEDIDTVLLSLVNEVVNSVVRERSVGNTVGATEQHLEGDVGDELSHLAESVPGVLVEESHGDIEGSTTPALKGVEVGEGVAGLVSNAKEIDSSDTGSQERLMGVTPGGVHEKASLVVADSLGKGLGALLKDDVSPSLLARLADIELAALGGGDLGDDDLALELGLTDLALDAATVDGNISKVSEKLLGTVLAADEVEQRGGIIDEGGPAVTVNEDGVSEESSQEGDVGLDTSDTELDQGTENLAASDFIGRTVACGLDQHGIVESYIRISIE